MRETEALGDARHEMEICNACRYCEGFCAVFPAMELRREFADGDLSYLANLCHNCQGCFYACQYAPPHPNGASTCRRRWPRCGPRATQQYAWPRPLARLFQRNGMVVSLAAAAGLALVLLLSMLYPPDPDARPPGRCSRARSIR